MTDHWAFSASPITPVDTPFRYSQSDAASSDLVFLTEGDTNAERKLSAFLSFVRSCLAILVNQICRFFSTPQTPDSIKILDGK